MSFDASRIATGPTSRATHLGARRPTRRGRRSAPLLLSAAAFGAGAACGLATPAVSRAGTTYYFTGGAGGTGKSIYVSTGATTGSAINTVDRVYNASGGTSPGTGSNLIIDSTDNTSSGVYIGGGTSTSSSLALNSYLNLNSLTFGNASSPTQLPATLYLDDTLAGGSTQYTLTLNAGTGTLGGTDLLATASNVGSTIEIRGTNGSSASTASNVLTSMILGSSGNFNVSAASAVLRIDTNISNDSTGAYGITKTGAGTLFLYESGSSFAGGVTLNSGTLEIYGGGSLGANPAAPATQLTFAGNSTLSFYTNAGVGANRTFMINNGVTATLDPQGLGVVLNNSIIGGGSLVKSDTGTITVNGSTSYGGNTTVTGGTLVLNGANTYGGFTNVSNGATLNVGSGATLPSTTALTLLGGTLTLAGARTANVAVASTTFGGTGASTLNIGAFNAGTGTLALGSISRTGSGSADINPGTTGTIVTTTTPNGTGTGNSGGIIGGYLTYGGGATFAANDGAGNIIGFTGYVTDYTVATTPSDFDATTSGTFTNPAINSLRFNTPGMTATTNGSLTVGTGGILVTPNTTGSTVTLAGGTVTSGNGTDLIVDEFGGPLLLTAGVTGSVNLTKAGTGTLIVDGSNSYTGTTNIQAGTLQVGNGDANGTLSSAAIVDNGVLSFNQSTPVVTSANVITGTGSLQQNGNNTLVLTTSSSYSGGTVINAGVLQFATTNYAGTGAFTINSGALRQTAALTSARSFTLGSATSTVDVSSGVSFAITGTFTGPGTLNLNSTVTSSTTGVADTGTLTLESASNNYSGGTIVNAGTLYGYFGTSFGSGPLVIGAAATKVEFNDAASTANIASTLANNVVLNSSTAFIQVGTGIYLNTLTASGTISGPGVLYKLGPGAIILTSTGNTYSGGTNVGQGVLTTTVAGAYGTGDLLINPVNTAGTAVDNTTVNASTGSIATTANVTVNSETADGVFGVGLLNITGSTTIGSLAGNGIVNVNANTLTVGANNNSTTFTGKLNGSGGSLVKAGTGTLSLANAGNTYSGGTNVSGGTLSVAVTGALPLNTALAVGAGASLVTVPHGAGPTVVLNLSSLSVAGSAGAYTGKVDLADNAAVVHNADVGAVSSLAAQGFGGGSWNGSGGLVSAAAAADAQHLTGLGVIPNLASDGISLLYASFDGQAVTTADVLARYTYYGDTNLDGSVNAGDYTRIDAGFVMGLTGWANGDFNYDGVVDGSDYTLMDNAFNQQSAAGLGAPASGVAEPAALVASPAAALAGGTAAVPEPGSLALLGVGAAGLFGRRRRRQVR